MCDKDLLAEFWKLNDSNAKARKNAITNITIYAKQTKNQEYCLTRLIKSLTTTNHSARIGFVTCLLQILKNLDLDSKIVFQCFEKHVINFNCESKAEKTGKKLGILLGVLALAETNYISQMMISDLNSVLDLLIPLFEETGLQKLACLALCQINEKVTSETFCLTVFPKIKNMLTCGWSDATASSLQLLLSCVHQKEVISSSFLKTHWNCKKVFCDKNFSNIFDVLQKGLDGNNSVLNPLMKVLLNKITLEEKRDLVVQFFVAACDRFCSIESSTPLKSLCFVSFFYLIQPLSKLPSEELGPLMERLICPSFCAQLRFHLSRRDSLLHGLLNSQFILILNTCRSSNPTLGAALCSSILSTEPLFDLDVAGPCRVAGALLSCMSGPALKQHCERLHILFEHLEKQKHRERLHVLGQLRLTAVCSALSERAIAKQLLWLARIAFFDFSQPAQNGVSSSSLSSESVFKLEERLSAQNALFKALDQLATGGLKERSGGEARYHTILLHLCRGIVKALNSPDATLCVVSSLSKTTDADDASDEEEKELVSQPASVTKLACDSLNLAVELLTVEEEKASGSSRTGFALLTAHLALHTLVDSNGMADLLADVAECQRRAENRHVVACKKQHQVEAQVEQPHWSDVMMDAMRSLLSQPSHLLRTVVKLVMHSLANHVEPSAVILLSEVLIAEEIRDDEDDDDDDENDEDSGEEASAKLVNGEASEEACSSSEEESSEEEEGVKEEVISPELLALRRQVEDALGSTVARSDAEDSDLEDDDVMFAQDEKLSAAFRALKRPNKQQREERLRQLLQLKMRCLDLFEVLLTICNRRVVLLAVANTLLQTLASRENELVARAAKLLRLLEQKRILDSVGAAHDDNDHIANGREFVEKLFTVTSRLALSQLSLSAALACLKFARVLFGDSLVEEVLQQVVEKFLKKTEVVNRSLLLKIFQLHTNLVWSLRNAVLNAATDSTVKSQRCVIYLPLLQALLGSCQRKTLPKFDKFAASGWSALLQLTQPILQQINPSSVENTALLSGVAARWKFLTAALQALAVCAVNSSHSCTSNVDVEALQTSFKEILHKKSNAGADVRRAIRRCLSAFVHARKIHAGLSSDKRPANGEEKDYESVAPIAKKRRKLEQ